MNGLTKEVTATCGKTILVVGLSDKDELLAMSSNSYNGKLADALCGLSQCDKEFETKFKQLLNETKQRLQKEFDEL